MMMAGVALRLEHMPWIDSRPPGVDCLEIIAEPFYKHESQRQVRRLAETYPLIVRGLELSLGTPGPLDQGRLDDFARVVQAADPLWVSEHIGFRRTDEADLGCVCPLPPTPETIEIMADHVRVLGERCAKPVILETITTDLRITGRLSESDFLNRLCEAADCGLLLDVTSLFVNSRNHRFDPRSWLRDIDPRRIVQLHVGGFSYVDNRWEDAHREAIQEDLWDLVGETLAHAPVKAVILEWEENFPPVGDLERDLQRLKTVTPSAVPVSDPPGPSIHRGGVMAGSHADSGGRAASPEACSIAVPGSPRRKKGDGGSPVCPADDVGLFILDDGGIFFSESRQELHSFNTAATFIWCGLEEAHSPGEIARSFADAFGVANSEAQRIVADLIHYWQGLGFVSGFEHPSPPEIDFTTALGRLLKNSTLREAFARSPGETARLLPVGETDRDTFVALDPDGLELQARLIRTRKRAFRNAPAQPGNAATTSFADRLRTRDWSSFPIERHYRLLTSNFCLRFQSAAQEKQVHPVLAHLETEAPETIDVTLDIIEEKQGHLLIDGGVPIAHCSTLDQVAPSVKASLQKISVDRHSYFLKIHAGVVSNGNSCLLLPAAPGSGKTVLTGALACSGFDYLSDEIALLDEETLAVRPMPLAMAVKPGALEPLGRYYPQVRDLPTHLREDEQVVRYLNPPPPSHGTASDTDQPVRWIIFPRYAPDGDTVMTPIGRIEAFRRLMQELMVLPSDLDKNRVAGLVRWMRTVACFELTVSSLTEAIGLIQAQCLDGPAAPKGG